MQRKVQALLWDLEDAASGIEAYIAGLDRVAFLADRMRQDAVAYRFMVLGESLVRLDREAPELAARIPERKRAIGLRNHLAHGYHRIDYVTVWDTAARDLPDLRRKVRDLLSRIESAPAKATVKDDERQPTKPSSFDR